MRKTIITITVVLLILSILGTGILVYVETNSSLPTVSSPSNISGETR